MWAKQGRVLKAASRWHLQGIKLLPKSPLGSSPLGRGTGREGVVVLRKVIRSKSYSLKKTREEEEGKERERERDPNLNHPNPKPDPTAYAKNQKKGEKGWSGGREGEKTT